MTDFTVHTVEIAPVEAKPRLQGAQDALGFVPNLYATMAEAPTSRLNEKMGLRLQTKIYLFRFAPASKPQAGPITIEHGK